MSWLRTPPLAAIALCCFLAAPTGVSRRWEQVGPGGGGALFLPTVSPTDPNRVLVACDMTGAYISDDAGQSWRMFNLRGRVRLFAFDPHDANTIYAQTIGLWRTTDAGRTWQLVYPNPKIVTGVAMANDHAGETLLTSGRTDGLVTAFAVDPSHPKMLYGAFRQGTSSQIQISSDWGKTWQVSTDLPGVVHKLYVDPHTASVFAVGDNFLMVREDGRWKNRTLPVNPALAVSASFSGSGKAVFYVSSASAIFISEDGAATWRQLTLPGSSAKIDAIAASPTHPDLVYVSYSGLREGLLSFGKKLFGVARTEDRGKTWDLVQKEADQPAPNLDDAWLSPLFGPAWPSNPIALVVAASDAHRIYSTDYGRVLRSSDGGEHWEAIYSTRRSDGTFAGRGLEATTSYGVHFDPFDPRRIFISYTDIGLFRSEDAGASWTSADSGVPPAWRNTAYWMTFDPEVRGRAWAARSKVHDLPRAKVWQRRAVSSFDGGVSISEDGGKTWRVSGRGLPPSAVTHILLDPASPASARVLYVTAFGRGVYKSSDGGKTWSLKNNGIGGNEPFAWRLARDRQGTLYVILARRSDDGSIGSQDDGALYKSTDGAEHWTRVNLPAGVNGPNGLAIDAQDSEHLLLAAWGRSTLPQSQGGGIFVSFDGGKSWRNVLAKDQHIYDVTADPRDPKVFYAAGFESSAWRSRDAGKSWQRIRGFNFKWGHRVIPDPGNPDKIYVTTFGGGVWHGPAGGDPNGIDEISTPALAHGN